MTQISLPPIMLSPTASNIITPSTRRIRRGTISSISKDVRVNDFVEIIKKQKELQQQERQKSEQLIKRRHSMMNISVNTQRKPMNKRLVSPIKQQILPLETNKIRLEKDTTISCCHDNHSLSDGQSSISSAISSSSLSSISSHTEEVEHDEETVLFNQLKALLTTYSKQVYNNNIEACKTLLSQQQNIIQQLDSFKNSHVPIVNNGLSQQKQEQVKLTAIVKDWFTLPKPSTTSIVIKQTQDKDQASAIFQVSGICTTYESSLIPDKLLYDITSFNQKGIHQYKYTLNISFEDRHQKFKILNQDLWQKDQFTDECSMKQCHEKFNLFSRRHHCRSCGFIYCNKHSGNRLPLFAKNNVEQPQFSRVCDKCFFSKVSDALQVL